MFVLAGVAPVQAQDSALTWTDRAELSVVWTAGNASSKTLGAKNTLEGTGGRIKFRLEAGGIRTESSIRTRVANGTAGSFAVTETSVSQTTAESYFTRSRLDYGLSKRTYFFGGAGWDRNTFSGISSRFALVSGAAGQWSDTDVFKFRTDIGVTYTIQDNVADGPIERFGGVRFTWELLRQVTPNTTLDSKLIVDENVKNTDDLRGDLVNSLTVAMNQRMALKTSLQLLFDNDPSFVDIPLVTGGVPTGGTVAAPLKKLDSIFTVALVINVK